MTHWVRLHRPDFALSVRLELVHGYQIAHQRCSLASASEADVARLTLASLYITGFGRIRANRWSYTHHLVLGGSNPLARLDLSNLDPTHPDMAESTRSKRLEGGNTRRVCIQFLSDLCVGTRRFDYDIQ
jgi:hypothetical protein